MGGMTGDVMGGCLEAICSLIGFSLDTSSRNRLCVYVAMVSVNSFTDPAKVKLGLAILLPFSFKSRARCDMMGCR